MKTKLEIKAEKLLRIDSRRKAHNAALSMLHASPLKEGETHEERGLNMWRKLRRIEAVAHDAATAQCNGKAYNGQPFRPDYNPATGDEDEHSEWAQFVDNVRAQVSKVFGGRHPVGFFFNGDARGYSLKLDPEKCTIPPGMEKDWGGYGLLAAEINE